MTDTGEPLSTRIRNAFVRPNNLFGSYGMDSRAKQYDDFINEIRVCAFRDGHTKGHDEGYDEGYQDGLADGMYISGGDPG